MTPPSSLLAPLASAMRHCIDLIVPAAPTPAADGLGDALRTSEARYRGIVETQQATVMRLDFTGRIAFVNEYCCEFVGVTRDEVIGQAYVDWVHPDDRAALVVALEELSRSPYRARGLSRVIAAGGRVRWLEWEGTTILAADGTPVELQSIGRDVTDRVEVERALQESLAELRASEERLRLLARHQAAIREEERKRVSFDLHDGICQEIVGIGILVEAAQRRLGSDAEGVVADLERVTRYLRELGEHVRTLAIDLRPMLLRDIGLEGSLRALAAGLSRDGVRVETTFAARVPRLDELAEVAIYRIAQEAVTNALRHAGAPVVTLSLLTADDRLRLEVRDAGRGFDPVADTGTCAPALGIVGMQERALALGGHLEVRSRPGDGTSIVLEFPLAARAG